MKSIIPFRSTHDAREQACKDMGICPTIINTIERLIFKRQYYEELDTISDPITIDNLMLIDPQS